MLSKNRLSLLRVAKARLALGEEDYRDLLERFGGARSARELDDRGFDAVMERFRDLGFTSDARKRSYGDRIGMATPAQVAKIRALWLESVENPTEPALLHWLERFHHVSSLRFLTAEKTSKVITGLKAMAAARKAKAHAA